jgi:hypothetical protein
MKKRKDFRGHGFLEAGAADIVRGVPFGHGSSLQFTVWS